MQEEVNQKVITLCINGGKLSARILKNAIIRLLRQLEQMEKQQQRSRKSPKQERSPAVYHGKQSMNKLLKQNCQLTNIEVTDGNIKSFEKYARKYHIDFSLKKDTSVSPPRYFVFFKAKDVNLMTAAFKEYTGKTLSKEKKPSLRKKLMLAKERMAKHREREKSRQKERGPEH